jgi:hypothetical protein
MAGRHFIERGRVHALRGLRALPMMQGETALVPMDDEDHDSISEPHYRLVVRPDQVLSVFLQQSQHYAFLIGEADFDAVQHRIRELRLEHWADPMRGSPGVIN